MPLRQKPAWLDAVYDQHWAAVFVEHNQDIVATMPYATTRRLGVAMMRQAPLCTYGGYWLSPQALGGADAKPERQRGNRHKLIAQLIGQLPKTVSNRWRLHPDFYLDGLPWHTQQYLIHTQYTYRLDLRYGSPPLWDNLRHHLRSDIRRAQNKLSLHHVDFDWQRHGSLIENQYIKQNKPFPFKKNVIQRLSNSGLLWCLEARYSDNQQLAGMIAWGYDHQEATLLFYGTEQGSASAMPLQLMIWHSLLLLSKEGLHTADLEGSMLPNVEHQLRAWGGQWTPYLMVERTRWADVWRSLFVGR